VRSLRQRVASLVTAGIFLAILYALFKKVHIFVLVHVPWWGLLLVLAGVWFLIESTVSRTLGAKTASQRAKDQLGSVSDESDSQQRENRSEIRRRLDEFRK
jgi:hypothetical protein